MHLPNFTRSELGSVGVELEIQLLDAHTLDLKPCAPQLLALLAGSDAAHFKQEVTRSMLEINSGVHYSTATLLQELRELGERLLHGCGQLQALPCGGGTHPFQDWRQRQISDHPRYHAFAAQYGYLARQFTVFGQHVHIGCPDGDSAIWLCHALGYYVPHLIALSAASPYVQGEASGYASARSNTVLHFPNSGHLPASLRQWHDFGAHCRQLASCGVIASLKDLYWDIRPKPEYGTVEVRVLDTPLTLTRATELAALIQTLALYLVGTRPCLPGRAALYSVYQYNRFQAARFGADAEFIDVCRGQRRPLREASMQLLEELLPYAAGEHARNCLLALIAALHDNTLDYQQVQAVAGTPPQLASLPARLAARWQQ